MNACDFCKKALPLGNESDHVGQRFGKAQILIAEDDPLTVQDLKERLESLDYEVPATTQYAREAIRLTESVRPDLILMDIQLLGEMDGIEAAEQIRVFQVPVVFISGYCDGPILQRAKVVDPYGYILKPYETGDLKLSIELGLHKHRAEQDRQRQYQRFQEVLASLKTLTGRLSICGRCKNIKDNDTDQWTKVETYVMNHSHATFTHGMCPECFARVKKQIEALEENGADSGPIVLG